jgi:hypothetical protein
MYRNEMLNFDPMIVEPSGSRTLGQVFLREPITVENGFGSKPIAAYLWVLERIFGKSGWWSLILVTAESQEWVEDES